LLDGVLNNSSSDKDDNCFAIKIILTRGEGERGYVFPDKAVSNRIVLVSKLDTSYSSLLSNKLFSGGLFLCEQQVSINKQLAGLKHLNRLENVMARNEWGTHLKGANVLDGLMLNANQHVIEGCMSNLFAVRNNELLTPDLSLSGVNGIMRQVIIDLADKLDIKLTIMNLSKDEILAMDELFISNSLIGIKSVTCLNSTTYNRQRITKLIFENLINTMNDHVHSAY
jgi:4-amino-4-deoxychorismate lyase